MANTKISALPSATLPLAGTEVLPIVQSGVTDKVAVNDLTVKNVRSNATTGILQIAGPTAGTTRTMTTPDANFTAARTDAGQTFTGTQVFNSDISMASGKGLVGASGSNSNIPITPDGTGAVALGSRMSMGGIITREFSKSLSLTSGVSTTIFTFALPQINVYYDNLNLGFEISYVAAFDRVTSGRSWYSGYGKVQGVISRGYESASSATPSVLLGTTQQLMVIETSGWGSLTLTWSASIDAGADNGAKNVYIAATLTNPASGTQYNGLSACIKYHTYNQNGYDITSLT